jgi:hypothetical protein
MGGITDLKPRIGRHGRNDTHHIVWTTHWADRMEYQFWVGVSEKLGEFSDSTKAADRLPSLDNIIENPLSSWAC